MIRDYQAFLARRWNELDMPAKTHAAADDEDTQRPIQVAWLIQAVGELRHTTLHEGREHPDVGLLFKDSGNHFDAGNGLKIANDIICVSCALCPLRPGRHRERSTRAGILTRDVRLGRRLAPNIP